MGFRDILTYNIGAIESHYETAAVDKNLTRHVAVKDWNRTTTAPCIKKLLTLLHIDHRVIQIDCDL